MSDTGQDTEQLVRRVADRAIFRLVLILVGLPAWIFVVAMLYAHFSGDANRGPYFGR